MIDDDRKLEYGWLKSDMLEVDIDRRHRRMQGSLFSPKIEFFIKCDMRGLSFFSRGHL